MLEQAVDSTFTALSQLGPDARSVRGNDGRARTNSVPAELFTQRRPTHAHVGAAHINNTGEFNILYL